MRSSVLPVAVADHAPGTVAHEQAQQVVFEYRLATDRHQTTVVDDTGRH